MVINRDSKTVDQPSCDEHMYSWYFSKEELEKFSASRKDGIDERKESELRQSYCSFLREVGIRLKLPQITIATAIMFCHRFYLHQSHAKNGWQTVATVCIFLASKVEDTPCPLDQVIRVAYEIMYKRDHPAAWRINQKDVWEKQKALILIGERLVLATIRFDFNIQHPYRSLLEAIKDLGITQKEVKQVAWNFVNDWLRTTLCLQYKPHYIAAGSLYLAAKLHNVKLPLEGAHVWWHKFDVAPKPLEAVIQQMMEMLGLKKSPVAHPIKQNMTPSAVKLQVSNSPDSVLNQSSLSTHSSCLDDNSEANGHVQVDSSLITRHTVHGENSCPVGRSSIVNASTHSTATCAEPVVNNHTNSSDTLDGKNSGQAFISSCASGSVSSSTSNVDAFCNSTSRCVESVITNCNHSGGTLNGESSDHALISRCAVDRVSSCLDGRLSDVNAVCGNTSKRAESVITNCCHSGATLNVENSDQVLISKHNGDGISRHSGDGVNSCSDGKLSNVHAVSDRTTKCIEPMMINRNHSSDTLNGENSCSDQRPVDVAFGNEINASPVQPVQMNVEPVQPVQMNVDHLNDGFKKVDVSRIRAMMTKRKRQREVEERAVTSADLSEEAWIEKELESGIVIHREAQQAVPSDDLSEEAWIERELESGIIVGPETARGLALDGLSEEDWIERELESGIITRTEPVGKKRRIESRCC